MTRTLTSELSAGAIEVMVRADRADGLAPAVDVKVTWDDADRMRCGDRVELRSADGRTFTGQAGDADYYGRYGDSRYAVIAVELRSCTSRPEVTAMGLFSRRRESAILAVPLTPAEAQLLVTALREYDRVKRAHYWGDTGSGYARSEARSVLRAAGTAAALGHPVVPVPVQDLLMYDDVLLPGLERPAADSRITRDFGQLLARMHALSGMARAWRWQAEWSDAGLRWKGQPPVPPEGSQAAGLPPGTVRR